MNVKAIGKYAEHLVTRSDRFSPNQNKAELSASILRNLKHERTNEIDCVSELDFSVLSGLAIPSLF